jgi:hypothetical protein
VPDSAIASLGGGPVAEQTIWFDYGAASPGVEDKELDDLIDAWHRHDDAAIDGLLTRRLTALPFTLGANLADFKAWRVERNLESVPSTPEMSVVGSS